MSVGIPSEPGWSIMTSRRPADDGRTPLVSIESAPLGKFGGAIKLRLANPSSSGLHLGLCHVVRVLLRITGVCGHFSGPDFHTLASGIHCLQRWAYVGDQACDLLVPTWCQTHQNHGAPTESTIPTILHLYAWLGPVGSAEVGLASDSSSAGRWFDPTRRLQFFQSQTILNWTTPCGIGTLRNRDTAPSELS